MRWLSFVHGGKSTFGIVKGEGVVDVGALAPELLDLKAAIAAGRLGELGQAAAALPPDLPLAGLKYLPVIANPAKILCAGLNYKTHQDETGRGQGDEHPTIFVRFAAAQVAHGEAMWLPGESKRLDFEGEIALVIGKPGRRIAKEDWLGHVAGFAPYNDGSVRDWQRHTTQFTPGKNFARTGGFGPWMMTPDEVGDPEALELTTRLNGEVMQNAQAKDLIFGFGELVAYCSAFIDLEAGDVIVTGTPGGVGAARKPALWMKPGDTIEVDVKPVGTLANSIVAEPA